MSFRRRPYTEVLDNLLTGILGGVTAETHPFPPPGDGGPPYGVSLEKTPVARVVSVYGSRNDRTTVFKPDADYVLAPDAGTLEWKEGGQFPDPGTLFHVKSLPASAGSPITDVVVGSVTRTLAESIGLEIARLYAQLEAVYNAGFIDTATGRALDNVVALLGIERVKAGRFSGDVVFTRADGSRGAVFIPAGTRLVTADGEVEYATVAPVTLADGQKTARVAARDLEPNPEGVPADALTVLVKPIAGIRSVTNPSPTGMTGADETDAQLRDRAKHFLHGSERATIGALAEAVSRQGVPADVTEATDGGRQTGEVIVSPHAESLPPELRQRILTAIHDARPAGVYVHLSEGLTAPVKVHLTLRITTAADLLTADLRRAQADVGEKIADYFARLAVADPGSANRLIGLILSVPEIQDVTLLSIATDEGPAGTSLPDLTGKAAALGDLTIIDPNLPTRLQLLIRYPDGAPPPDKPGIQSLLGRFLDKVNSHNAAETVSDAAVRSLTHGKLLYIVRMAGDPSTAEMSAEEIDAECQGVLDGSTGPMPDPAALAPYTVRFTLTMESGRTRIMGPSDPVDAGHDLTPFERVSLAEINIEEEATDGE